MRLRFDTAGNSYVSRNDLQASMFGGPLPLTEQTRRYYGRTLTPEHIEQVLLAADCGFMRDLTDLTKETFAIDPHLLSVTGKRFRALASVRANVVEATGDGIDPKLAKQVADVVRQQLAWVPNLKQNLMRLNWGHCNGRAALEKVWRENPGGPVRWRLEKLHWIHPRRLSFGPERELRVRDDYFGGTGFEAKGLELRAVPFKFISFTPQQFDDYPEREGFGPRALYFSFFKRFNWRERLILLEVFGKPWRIVYTDSPTEVQQETLDEAGISADAMGANATGVMPPGVKADIKTPGQGAGTMNKDVAADCNDEISKLVLGTTRTTDAKPGALGSAGDEVGQEEQTGVVAADGWNLSDLATEQIAGDITVLNFGAESLPYCPRIELAYEIPASRGVKIERTAKVFDMGIPLKASEVYENVGFAQPGPEDVVIQKQAAPAVPPGGGGAPPTDGFPSDDGGDDGGNPLGDGGVAVPDGDQLRAGGDRDLAVLRAVRVLELVSAVQGRR